MNAVPIISGAFGVFRREVVVSVGGFRHDSLGEDMELVLRLHRHYRDTEQPYRIAFQIKPVCWTEAPETLRSLRNQRIRWQRGLGESLVANRGLLFHRRGGAAGWLMFPFMIVFELFGPLVELCGYLFMAIAYALGHLSAESFWSFLLLALSLGILLSISALLLEEISCRTYRRPGNLFALVCMTIVENFGYHQIVLWWRLRGLYQWATRAPARWG
jgi:cellulose synthase/poly-beta-1,6-N-acetylglucosamine synthase-like glycosyltransferase